MDNTASVATAMPTSSKTNCPSCTAELPEGSRYCPACGASREVSQGMADWRAEPMLAEANLLRMRGQWQDAETRCIETLRLDPNNVHAHSLLGDIYRDQGRYDDAAQWYQMALDLNPASAADRAKLTYVEKLLAKSVPAHSGSLGGTQPLLGLSPVLWIRGLTAISVAFIVIVVAIVLTSRGSSPRETRGTVPGSAGTVTTALPTGTTGGPLPLPRPPQPSSEAAKAPTSRPATSAPATPNIYTDRELALRDQVTRQAGLGPETTVAEATIEPREQRASLLLLQTTSATDPSAVREAITRTALAAAHAAFLADQAIQRVTVEVRIASSAGRADPAFSGDVERLAFDAAQGSGGGPDQALSAFTSVWWAPGLQQAASAPSAGAAPSGGATGL